MAAHDHDERVPPLQRLWRYGSPIVESGTHDELVTREGACASLWAVQTGAAARHVPGAPPISEARRT